MTEPTLQKPVSPLEALMASGVLPRPGNATAVSHEQLYWAIHAFDQNVTFMRGELAYVTSMQVTESRALTDRLVQFNKLSRDVAALKRLAGLEIDEQLEEYHRESHPGHDHDTDRSPPPDLDADERTTPGYRISVPDVDGDPGP